ncbi:inositol monophosphatase family protein, partial [Bacteroidota bacterium]
LSDSFPQFNMVGEEKGARFTGSEYTWIIDPLDGTSNYAAGIPWFGILIALMFHDKPTAAGAYLPIYDDMYYAEVAKGATCNGKPIKVIRDLSMKEILMGYSTDYAVDRMKTKFETDLFGDLISKVRNTRSTNSLLDFCYVADGRFGGCINHNTKIWDIAAPYLIIKEAKGRMSDLYGHDIQFDLSNTEMSYQVVASARHIHGEIIDIIRNHL